MTALSDLGAKLAPWFMGVAITALGLEHFIFARVTSPQVPLWIPETVVGNYLTGTALIACGIGFGKAQVRRNAATLLAVLIFLSMLVFHLPVVLRSPRFESDWTKTLVLSGGFLLLAKIFRENENSNETRASNLASRPHSKDATALPDRLPARH